MGLAKKLRTIKETIVEDCKEYATIKDMSAKEIAKRYGYSWFLSYVRTNLIFNQEAKNVNENGEEKEDNNSILLKINRDKNGMIIICHEEFGEKETFNLDILKFMLKKDNIDITIELKDDEEFIKIELAPQKATLEDKLEEIYDNGEEYLDALKDKAKSAKEAAGNATKKLLNTLADWANDKL